MCKLSLSIPCEIRTSLVPSGDLLGIMSEFFQENSDMLGGCPLAGGS